MEEVLIVSKTRMHNGICIGGLCRGGQNVRLKTKDGHNQSESTPFEIGQIWLLNIREEAVLHTPHTEEVRVIGRGMYAGVIDGRMEEVIREFGGLIYSGPMEECFENNLVFTDWGSAFVHRASGVPNSSVLFWKNPQELRMNVLQEKVHYLYKEPPEFIERSLPFVGLQEPIEIIKENSLVRLSLARWWNRELEDGTLEDRRSYLQLSGWYD